jgi:amylosucrase
VYLRCHDDIGWAIDDSDAHSVGLNGHLHRMFLADYFNGTFPGSDARGVDFQIDPASGEKRTSGTASALSGIQAALKSKDRAHLDVAINRYLCAYAMVFGFGGIPLLYMGDEIGLLNDETYLKDAAKADDSRWANRPPMKWTAAERAATELEPDAGLATYTERAIRVGIQKLISVRQSLPSLHASVATVVTKGKQKGVVIFNRRHAAGHLVQVYNLSDQGRWVGVEELGGLHGTVTDHLTGHTFDIAKGMPLAPYESRWLTNPSRVE